MLVRAVTAGGVWAILYLTVGFSVREESGAWWGGLSAVMIGTLAVILLRWIFAFLVRTKRLRERVLFLGVTPTCRPPCPRTGGQPSRAMRSLGTSMTGPPINSPSPMASACSAHHGERTPPSLPPHGVRTIVMFRPERPGTFPLQPILECKLRGIRIEDWPAFYEKLTGKIVVQDLRTSWLVFSEGFHRTLATRTMKRWIDLVLAGLFLALAGPLLLLVAASIRLNSPGPIFFSSRTRGQGWPNLHVAQVPHHV